MKQFLPILIFLFACQKSQTQTELPKEYNYEPTPQAIQLSGPRITEASGITYSSVQEGSFWVNEDSGNPPLLYLVHKDGTVKDSLLLDGATNRDWEDITSGAGPQDGKNYIYVADIGDNDAKYSEWYIYRFEEPPAGVKQLKLFEKIAFVYEDGARDAEAIVINQATKDIYVISKRDTRSRVYKIAYPQSTTEVNTATFLFDFGYSGVVAATTSVSGEELLVKTYTTVYHYTIGSHTSLEDSLKSGTPKTLKYQLEPQGEAISFSFSGDGFYTLSEEAMGIIPKMYFYRKK